MNDSYQAIYDAARSKIEYADTRQAIMDAMRTDCSHDIAMIRDRFIMAADDMGKPSAIFRPSLSVDGNMWCALYGENLQDGIAGFGTSPAKAMDDFDTNWHKDLAK